MLCFHTDCMHLQDFLDGEKASRYLTKETRNELIHRATFDITSQYHGQATDLVTLVSREITIFNSLKMITIFNSLKCLHP